MATTPELSILQKWGEAGLIPPQTRRVIIDIAFDSIAKVYIEGLADSSMFTIDLEELLKGAKPIRVVEVPQK